MHYDDKGYYKMLWQQLKYGGKNADDIVEDYKKLLQQLKESIKEKIICTTKELLKFIRSY